MAPIFVMAEHPGDEAGLAAILKQPAVAGLLARLRYADLAVGQFADLDLLFTMLPAGKTLTLCASPLPMLPGSPSLTLDGEALPLAWDDGYLGDLAAILGLTARHIAKNGWMEKVQGIRCAFTTAVDGDCELGFRVAPPGGGSASYLQSWIDAGLTQSGFAASVQRHCADAGKLFADVSLSVLDPMQNRLGDVAGTTLPHEDHGMLARTLIGAAATGLGGSGASLSVFNTNFHPGLPVATMLFTQQMAAQYGRLGLQLQDSGSQDADFASLVRQAASYGPDRIEIHQRQATAGMFALL